MTNPDSTQNRLRRPGSLVLGGIVFLLGVTAGAFWVWQLKGSSSAQPAPVAAPSAASKVTSLGRIEPEGGVLTLSIPMPDRIEELLAGVGDGAAVEKDQELVKLQSHTARWLELKLIEQKLADATAQRDSLERKGKAQIEVERLRIKQLQEIGPLDAKLQQHNIKLLTRQLEMSRDDLKRLEGVAVSPQEKEQQKLRVFQAETALINAQDTRDKLSKNWELDLQTAQAQLVAAQATLTSGLREVPVESLAKQKSLAEEQLRQTILRAPVKGAILKILAQPGELVGAQQPILQMANTEQMVVVAEVYETDIHKVKLGHKAAITGRALQTPLSGVVVRIGRMVGKNRVYDMDPTADVDRRIVEVTVRLGQSLSAAQLIHMQVRVEILLDGS